ncbi:MAG: (2Fe-2S)-binding protein [Phycisphaeraceae bacterium]|nr:(2Fe-2S)-binding protein [Phycisphaerales bacterium]MCB9842004.1 (2Fe-2S)-binding protein [Phycisphaeraceae bacterium]
MPTPTITIDGKVCEFTPGQTILQIANANGIEIPQYCYHDGLSIVASCRICLAEVWAPNPRNDNKLEPIPKLLPTCQTTAGDGQVVYTNSPKSVANQKAVMEYLLINHPLDCPVCDQAGECLLQDYSYEYGRGVSRFEETKVKQPKKDLGPHVYLYSDRCIMCSRCVRFCREVTGTAEITIEGRGNQEQIDVFPGIALDNELSANVIDLCPVGALLDKDFLFAQRVWFLKSAPSIDGITASGDNILIEHNDGQIYRVKPRENMDVNKWWISDEIRYGWKFIHDEARLRSPIRAHMGAREECDFARAYEEAIAGLKGKHIALMVSPMLSCEEAYALAKAALAIDANAQFAVGPIPMHGENKTFPGGYTIYAEKCPNARGVRRVLEAVAKGKTVLKYEDLLTKIKSGEFAGLLLTGNYPSDWVTSEFASACEGKFVALIDTQPNRLTKSASIVIPGATFAEKSGVFENANNRLQAFEQAIPVIEMAKCEGQIAMDLAARASGVDRPERFNPANVRREMAAEFTTLSAFETEVSYPSVDAHQKAEVEVVEL